ncbi:MBL fold metallo-hydrolase [Thermodesulfobacteriota bacterium]
MSENESRTGRGSVQGVYKIVKENLKSVNADLTSFYFRPGGNIYVFSYEKEGLRRHTFIDAGDKLYRNQLLSLLSENDINPAYIDRIIITHRHNDHCGLTDLLATESNAKIVVHPAFRDFIEGRFSREDRWWLRGFDPTKLKEYNIEYLSQTNGNKSRKITGVDFPCLGEPIEIGEGGRLEILACPESTQRHSPDQIIPLYSPSGQLQTQGKANEDFQPTDDIVFSGDLWLMQGPIYDFSPIRHIRRILRFKYYQIKSWKSGKPVERINVQEQDAEAKDALKNGFNLVRVKPGHGEEFVGSRIIPQSLMAKRDLLFKLGFSVDEDKSILKGSEVAPRVAALGEQAYARFIKELQVWLEWGYTSDEISGLIARIYEEQKGGRGPVKKDRAERREVINATLARLRNDSAESDELNRLSETALSLIRTDP